MYLSPASLEFAEVSERASKDCGQIAKPSTISPPSHPVYDGR